MFFITLDGSPILFVTMNKCSRMQLLLNVKSRININQFFFICLENLLQPLY